MQLTAYLEQIATPLGGLSELALSTDELEKLVVWPGFLANSFLWDPLVDLKPEGFRPGASYQIYNSQRQYLYTVRSDSGYFGEATEDLNLLYTSRHGEYFFLLFLDHSQPTVGIIWVGNSITGIERQRVLDRIREVSTSQSLLLRQHEIFISTAGLPESGIVQVDSIAGSWHQVLRPNQITPEQRQSFPVEDYPSLYLVPTFNQWVSFSLRLQNQTIPLGLSGISGLGARRLRDSTYGSYYIELSASSLAAPMPVMSNHMSRSSVIGSYQTDHFLRLNAHLELFSPATSVVGRSRVNAIANKVVEYRRQFEQIAIPETIPNAFSFGEPLDFLVARSFRQRSPLLAFEAFEDREVYPPEAIGQSVVNIQGSKRTEASAAINGQTVVEATGFSRVTATLDSSLSITNLTASSSSYKFSQGEVLAESLLTVQDVFILKQVDPIFGTTIVSAAGEIRFTPDFVTIDSEAYATGFYNATVVGEGAAIGETHVTSSNTAVWTGVIFAEGVSEAIVEGSFGRLVLATPTAVVSGSVSSTGGSIGKAILSSPSDITQGNTSISAIGVRVQAP